MDLGVSLLQRWKLILSVVAVFLVVGATHAFKEKASSVYTYTAAIQLGGNAAGGNMGRLIFAEETAKSLLENGLLNLAKSQYAMKHKAFDVRRIKITVMAPKRSGGIFLVGKGPAELQSAYEEIETIATNLLNESTFSQTNLARRRLIESNLKKAQIQLQKLEDPQFKEGRKILLKQALLKAQTRLVKLRQNQQILKQELSGLEKSRLLDEQMSKELSNYLATTRADNLRAMNTNTPSEAMTAMLIGNQTQRSLQKLIDLKRDLTVENPKKESQIKAAIENNAQNQIIQQKTIEKAKIDLANFEPSELRAIELQKIEVNRLKDHVDHFPSTKLIGQPVRSKVQGKRRPITILAMFTFVGIFSALLVALLANYFTEVRRRLAAGKQTA